MSERGLPDGYVACQSCTWAGPSERYANHIKDRHGVILGDIKTMQSPLAYAAHMIESKPFVTSKPRRRSGEINEANAANKTEQMCLTLPISGNYVFEGHRFDICGGATYRPDWIDKDRKIAIEVKSDFIHSRDSRRRFDEAKHLFPDWTWIWARRRTQGRKGKRWEIEIYEHNN